MILVSQPKLPVGSADLVKLVLAEERLLRYYLCALIHQEMVFRYSLPDKLREDHCEVPICLSGEAK